jgi:hypothetical protein
MVGEAGALLHRRKAEDKAKLMVSRVDHGSIPIRWPPQVPGFPARSAGTTPGRFAYKKEVGPGGDGVG